MKIPQLSPPGWALSIMAVVTIIMQTPNIYNPSALMTEFQLSNKPAAQLIGKSNDLYAVKLMYQRTMRAKADNSPHLLAFCLVIINGYDLLGALQDNWTVYWYSLVSRAVVTVFLWTLGEPWSKLVAVDGPMAAILGVAMWFG